MEKFSMSFFADKHLCNADILPPSQVRARIEIAVLNFLKTLTAPNPAISTLPLLSRNSSNTMMNQGLLTHISSIFLSNSVCTRSLTRANAAKSFIRVWKVLELCYQILIQNKRVTQRELFYKLLCSSPDYFSNQLQVNTSIQDVVALLRCSRFSLGIMASSRGLVAGRLMLQEPNKDIVDCSLWGSSGYPISGDMHFLEQLEIKSDARYIIVVEKEFFRGKSELEKYKSHAESFICAVMPGSSSRQIKTTPGGLLYIRDSSNLQYVFSTCNLLVIYSKTLAATNNSRVNCGSAQFSASQIRNFAKLQVDYVLGSNPKNMSYMVGFGRKYPQQLHHRGASMPSIKQHPAKIGCNEGFSNYYNANQPNPNVHVGAIVGGPDSNDQFSDSRSDYSHAEPTTYINAAAIAPLADMKR